MRRERYLMTHYHSYLLSHTTLSCHILIYLLSCCYLTHNRKLQKHFQRDFGVVMQTQSKTSLYTHQPPVHLAAVDVVAGGLKLISVNNVIYLFIFIINLEPQCDI
jgi:hypothetical protein